MWLQLNLWQSGMGIYTYGIHDMIPSWFWGLKHFW